MSGFDRKLRRQKQFELVRKARKGFTEKDIQQAYNEGRAKGRQEGVEHALNYFKDKVATLDEVGHGIGEKRFKVIAEHLGFTEIKGE